MYTDYSILQITPRQFLQVIGQSDVDPIVYCAGLAWVPINHPLIVNDQETTAAAFLTCAEVDAQVLTNVFFDARSLTDRFYCDIAYMDVLIFDRTRSFILGRGIFFEEYLYVSNLISERFTKEDLEGIPSDGPTKRGHYIVHQSHSSSFDQMVTLLSESGLTQAVPLLCSTSDHWVETSKASFRSLKTDITYESEWLVEHYFGNELYYLLEQKDNQDSFSSVNGLQKTVIGEEGWLKHCNSYHSWLIAYWVLDENDRLVLHGAQEQMPPKRRASAYMNEV